MKIGKEEYSKGVSIFKLEALKIIPESKGLALDCGCGIGRYSTLLKNKGYKVIGVDINKKALKLCETKADKIIYLDLNKHLEFKNNKFDLIWCSEVIEHIEFPRFLIKELHRVLKKDGVLILTTPNSYNIYYRLMYLFGKIPKDLQNPTHLHFFDKKTLLDLVNKDKWQIQDFFGICPPKGYAKLPSFKINFLVSLLCGNFIVKLKKK